MRKQDPKPFPDPENSRAIVSGFGTQRSKPDSGKVRPVEPAPEARAVKRRRQGAEAARVGYPPLTEPERELSKDAERQARQLKRQRRALYASDPRRFRKVVRLAQSEVLR